MNVGDIIHIQSFKHDKSLHRTWSKGFVVDVSDTCWVLVTYKTTVIESNGRLWQTREPAVCFFYPDKWYNIIAMIRKNGITYYCNVASPSVVDEEALKNIDYDLDLKVYPTGQMEVLDEGEFALHQRQMEYPKEIIAICEAALAELIEKATLKEGAFNQELVLNLFNQYLTLNRKSLK